MVQGATQQAASRGVTCSLTSQLDGRHALQILPHHTPPHSAQIHRQKSTQTRVDSPCTAAWRYAAESGTRTSAAEYRGTIELQVFTPHSPAAPIRPSLGRRGGSSCPPGAAECRTDFLYREVSPPVSRRSTLDGARGMSRPRRPAAAWAGAEDRATLILNRHQDRNRDGAATGDRTAADWSRSPRFVRAVQLPPILPPPPLGRTRRRRRRRRRRRCCCCCCCCC